MVPYTKYTIFEPTSYDELEKRFFTAHITEEETFSFKATEILDDLSALKKTPQSREFECFTTHFFELNQDFMILIMKDSNEAIRIDRPEAKHKMVVTVASSKISPLE